MSTIEPLQPIARAANASSTPAQPVPITTRRPPWSSMLGLEARLGWQPSAEYPFIYLGCEHRPDASHQQSRSIAPFIFQAVKPERRGAPMGCEFDGSLINTSADCQSADLTATDGSGIVVGSACRSESPALPNLPPVAGGTALAVPWKGCASTASLKRTIRFFVEALRSRAPIHATALWKTVCPTAWLQVVPVSSCLNGAGWSASP